MPKEHHRGRVNVIANGMTCSTPSVSPAATQLKTTEISWNWVPRSRKSLASFLEDVKLAIGMRRFAKGAAGYRIVEANLYAKNSENERALAKADRDLRPFHFLLSAVQAHVVVPFGRYAKREFAGFQVNCPVEQVKHFSSGWGTMRRRSSDGVWELW